MTIPLFLALLYGFIVICLSLLSFVIIKNMKKQTETITNIMTSYSDITLELKSLISKLDNYEKDIFKRGEGQKELVTSALKHISDRMEKLENSNKNTLSKLDTDINRLYMYCSRKIERENTTLD
jgi:predicted PurR-regulated permease PerM